ncbi:MAG: isochorismate synthase [Alicyclobacillaceae bacterium]|nr:isochorismate synthase [Alicyclobacillaceae bacterium]
MAPHTAYHRVSIDLSQLERVLSERVQEAARRAAACGRRQIAAATVTSQIADGWLESAFEAAATAAAAGTDRADVNGWLWREPGADGCLWVASGAVETAAGFWTGRDCFQMAAREYEQWRADVVRLPTDNVRWFAGFAFAPGPRRPPWQGWPDGCLVFPRVLWMRRPDGSGTVTVCVPVAVHASADRESLAGLVRQAARHLEQWLEGFGTPLRQKDGEPTRSFLRCAGDAFDSAEAWKDKVARLAARLAAGELEKLVLARAASVSGLQPGWLAAALTRLERTYPECVVFAVCRGPSCFLGATPEVLAGCGADGAVWVDCLAGTAPRGRTDAEDRVFGQGLLDSWKNRREHEVVVRWVAESLSGLATDVQIPQAPRLRKLPNVQHLYTPVRGHLRPSASLLNVVERLHPTPAVAGMPREAAVAAAGRWESFDRGWYAGPLGWLDADGAGVFVVALRSALALGDQALLFAGNGIMSDSDPESEWLETELKLQPMRHALQALDGEENGR